MIKVLMLDLKSYYPSPPYQLGLLVAYACTQEKVKSNMNFVFSEHDRETDAGEIANAVLKEDADLLAISDYAWNHKKVCDILNLLVASGTKLPRILLGGPNCSGKLGEEILNQYSIVSALVEAEEYSKRYSMPPVKFMSLLKNAHEKEIDTYTDIIIGLPGESLPDFINGLDTVTTTAVPSIKIHQLVLIPGTEFFDNKEELGLKVNQDFETTAVTEGEKSDYYDCTVVSHPLMDSDEMVRGRYMMGIVHLLHNHNLGQVVNHYLSRYDISNKQVFLFMEELLLNGSSFFPEKAHLNFLKDLREIFQYYTNKFGVDDNQFVMSISFKLWFTKGESGMREVNEPKVRAFMHDFYAALSKKHNCCQTTDEKRLLQEMIDYNVLIAPKPGWKPEAKYEFTYDVHQIWEDMLQQVMGTTDLLSTDKKSKSEKENSWNELPQLIRKRVKGLLSEDYLNSKKGSFKFKMKNPWGIPPSRKNLDWLLNSKSKHCIVLTENSAQPKQV